MRLFLIKNQRKNVKEVNDEDRKFIISDIIRISKYKNVSAKSYFPNWTVDVFVITNVKNAVPWRYITSDLKGKEIVGTFYKQ